MIIQIQILDSDNNPVIDTRTLESSYRINNLSFSSAAPKGYVGCSFSFSTDDIRLLDNFKVNYSIKVFNGITEVWYGKLREPTRSKGQSADTVNVQCLGIWDAIVSRRALAKVWVDTQPNERFIQPSDRLININQSDGGLFQDKRRIEVRVYNNAVDKRFLADLGLFWLQYDLPVGTYVKDFEYTYRARTGEGLTIQTVDDSDFSVNATPLNTVSTGIVPDGTGSITGTHNGGDNSPDLIDTTVNFASLGVIIGQSLVNVTDGGSETTITAINTTTNQNDTLVGTLLNGTENDWDNGESYLIHTLLSSGLISFSSVSSQSIQIRIAPQFEDEYDINDWIELSNIIIRSKYNSNHPDFGSETYTIKEIIIDVIEELFGNDLSTFYGDITNDINGGNPITGGFETKQKLPERGSDIINRLVLVSDSSQNVYLPLIFGTQGSPDGLPYLQVIKRDVSDPDYIVTIDELKSFSSSPDDSQLYNYISVFYTDLTNTQVLVTPFDEPTLKDDDSISEYGRIDPPQPINVGNVSREEAIAVGERYLARHKQPVDKTTMSIEGFITTKNMKKKHVSEIRASETIKVVDWKDGEVFFIGRTDYNINGEMCNISTDSEPDFLKFFVQQQKVVGL